MIEGERAATPSWRARFHSAASGAPSKERDGARPVIGRGGNCERLQRATGDGAFYAVEIIVPAADPEAEHYRERTLAP